MLNTELRLLSSLIRHMGKEADTREKEADRRKKEADRS